MKPKGSLPRLGITEPTRCRFPNNENTDNCRRRLRVAAAFLPRPTFLFLLRLPQSLRMDSQKKPAGDMPRTIRFVDRACCLNAPRPGGLFHHFG